QRGAIGRVGELLAVLPHAVDGARGFVDQLVAPLLEEHAKHIEFALSHGELRGNRCSTGAGRTQSARGAVVRIAYLDAFSGVSGDMTVGALLDLGLPLAALREAIAALALPGVEVAVERVARSGIAATKFHAHVHGERPDQGPPAHHHGHRAWAEIRDLLAGSRLAAPVKERARAVLARLAAALAQREAVPEMRIEAVGYGAGDRELADRPNLLRILLGEPVVAAGADEVVVLEATIDDMSPQLYEHVLDRLLAAGARDAFL